MYLYEGRESCHYIAQSVSVQARDLVKTGWKFSYEESEAFPCSNLFTMI